MWRRLNSETKGLASPSPSEEERYFDFDIFLTSMKSSILINDPSSQIIDDIDLGFYLAAYDQLYNFFLLLGGAFQFVAVDVKNKIKLLQEYREDELKETGTIANFLTVQKMVDFERNNDLLNISTYVSGSRTLLRLHRGLDFFRKFLTQIYEADNATKLSGIARQVYDQTLAQHHTFVVRNSARVAMQFLTTRSELLIKIAQNDDDKLSHILNSFPDALQTMNSVYDKIQTVFFQYELLDLP